MAEIKQIINKVFKANSYLCIENNDCIVIDSNLQAIDFIISNKLNPVYMFLTHEHFDHIAGISQLKQYFPEMMVISSKDTSDFIQDPRKNMSFYYDGVGFKERASDIFIEDISTFNFLRHSINTFYTPGHTSGGIIVQIENMLFTGDTLLDVKTPTNMLNSSKKQLIESLEFIDNNFNDNVILYQGHGKPFPKIEWDINKSLGKKV